jgi:hypothetical protein
MEVYVLTIENPEGNLVEATVSGKITTDDITNLKSVAEKLINKHGKIKLLANASHFEGWEDIHSMEKHITFVKEHQANVERVAVIAGYLWQHWFAVAMRLFLKPDIKVFESSEVTDAKNWLNKRA